MRRLLDLVGDLLIDFSARRSRVLLMVVAVALSVGTLVTSFGISVTAAEQINADLAASGTDTLTVRAVPSTTQDDAAEATDQYFPDGCLARVAALRLVGAVGLSLDYAKGFPISRTRDGSGVIRGSGETALVGATSGWFAANQDRLDSGWLFDTSDSYPVVALGRSIAEDFGIPAGTSRLAGYRVYLSGTAYEVVGVFESAALANTVAVPYERALAAGKGIDSGTVMRVRTEPGGGAPVARIIRAAIRPDDPGVLAVSTVVDLASLRTGVGSQLGRLAGAIGALLLALTTLLIANSMIVSVVARTAEIGLRRSLGASRGAITALFLADGACTGILGGFGGSAVGCAAVVVVASINAWSAILTPWYLAVGPGIGMFVGILASAYPAWRAGRISPAEAVRSE